MRFVHVLLLAALAGAPRVAPAKAWQGIVPGTSHREDVLTRFGDPSTQGRLGALRALVYREDRAITGTRQAQFLVNDEGVVTEVNVFPAAQLDREAVEGTYGKGAQKTFTDEFRAVWIYRSLGVMVFFSKDGLVEAIRFQPPQGAPPAAELAAGRPRRACRARPGRASLAARAGRARLARRRDRGARRGRARRALVDVRVVGLTGGIATGKSTFAARLRERGAPVLDADVLAREAVAKGSPGLAEVVAALGADVLAPDGTLDRKRVAERVFAEPEARARLERIVHPRVRAAMRDALARLAAAGAGLAFQDVPLLYEAGVDREVELVVVVWAPREAQLARLAARDGLRGAGAEARLAAQLPIDEKAARADVVVVNDGPLEALGAKADALLAALAAGLGRRAAGAPAARF